MRSSELFPLLLLGVTIKSGGFGEVAFLKFQQSQFDIRPEGINCIIVLHPDAQRCFQRGRIIKLR